MAIQERRKYPRLALRIDDGYFGNFILADNENLLGSILNFSAGGVNLMLPANKAEKVKIGDRIMLASIAGGANFSFVNHILSEIRWINSSNNPDYLSVGMKFLEVSTALREQMIEFVRSERIARGQYD